MVHSNGKNGKSEDKARALVTTGRVRMTEGGASVTNADGFVYRVDFDLGGRPHCQCKGFEHTGWCKHLTAAYMLAGKTKGKPEDDEPTDDEWIADTGTAYSLGHDRLLMLVHWTVTEGFQSVMRYY